VIVFFLNHLPLIDRELRNAHLMEIDEAEKQPVVYMSADQARALGLAHLRQVVKESGYRSVHYNVRLKQSQLPEQQRPVFELQVRTAAQDLWSALEHYLGYKPEQRRHTAVKKQLRILSHMLGAIDENFDLLYEQVNLSQKEQQYKASDLLSVESLPSVLGEIGIVCAQRDINNILKFLISRGIECTQDILDLGTPRRLEIIRNTFISSIGRQPFSLELIATLAAMKGSKDETEEIERIRMQIAYRTAWESMQQKAGSEI